MRTPFQPRIAIFAYLLLATGAVFAESVVPNPDFDLGTVGWNDGVLVDSDGSPSSPSYLVTSLPNNQREVYSDCFPIDATKRYRFAARMRIVSGSVGIVFVYWYSDVACAFGVGGTTPHVANSFSNGDWVALSNSTSFEPPASAIRAKVKLVANSGINQPGQVRFDHIDLQQDDIFAGTFDEPVASR